VPPVQGLWPGWYVAPSIHSTSHRNAPEHSLSKQETVARDGRVEGRMSAAIPSGSDTSSVARIGLTRCDSADKKAARQP
jgi:hypothetical protein